MSAGTFLGMWVEPVTGPGEDERLTADKADIPEPAGGAVGKMFGVVKPPSSVLIPKVVAEASASLAT